MVLNAGEKSAVAQAFTPAWSGNSKRLRYKRAIFSSVLGAERIGFLSALGLSAQDCRPRGFDPNV